MVEKTALAEFMAAHPSLTVTGFARQLGISRQRLQTYIAGAAIPRPKVLKRLQAATGLELEAFLFPGKRGRAA